MADDGGHADEEMEERKDGADHLERFQDFDSEVLFSEEESAGTSPKYDPQSSKLEAGAFWVPDFILPE